VQVRDGLPLYQQAGLRVVALSMGGPTRVREAREKLKLPFTLLCDPQRVGYTAYGLLTMDTRRERSLSNAAAMVRATLRHGGGLPGPEEDVRQLGGMFVVAQDGRLLYAHRALIAADLPPNEEIIAHAMASLARA